MSGYFFKTCDLEACSEYPSPVLVCSPEGCKICGISEDSTMVYETELKPLSSGNFHATTKIINWVLIEEYNVVEITSDSMVFDGVCSIANVPEEYLDTKLPPTMYIAKLPEQLKNYFGPVIFHSDNGTLTVEMVNLGMKVKVPTVYSNSQGKCSVQIHKDYIKEYVTDGYLKIYLETDFPICIEDYPHRTYIAPCVS